LQQPWSKAAGLNIAIEDDDYVQVIGMPTEVICGNAAGIQVGQDYKYIYVITMILKI